MLMPFLQIIVVCMLVLLLCGLGGCRLAWTIGLIGAVGWVLAAVVVTVYLHRHK